MATSLPHYNEIWSHPGKLLSKHLKNVGRIAKSSAEVIPLNFPGNQTIPEIAYIVGTYHDIGKATPFFQEYLREKDPNRKAFLKNKPETKHSLISAAAAYFAVEEYFKKENFSDNPAFFLPIASFLSVRRHHTNLQSATEDLRLDSDEVLKKQVENLYYEELNFLPYWSTVYEKLKRIPDEWPLRKLYLARWLKENEDILTYLIQHLLYSLLLDADKHEAAVGPHLTRRPLSVAMVENYRKNKKFDKPEEEIDVLRNEIYHKVTDYAKTVDLESDTVMSLSAPTGSGKTLTALAFSLELRKRIINEKKYTPRVIYSLPFLSIIDQNAETIREVFEVGTGKRPTSDLFLAHHHLSDYTYKEEDTEYGADESEILIEGWDSEIVITTFVQLFHTLFTNRNRAIRKFHKLAGSIILLDEIQSFPPKYWSLFRNTAEAMKKYFNTYFILSTATQPAIFENPKELLIEKEKYFKSFRRTRVSIKLTPPKTISEFANEFKESIFLNPQNTLVVLNTIRAAELLFKAVEESLQKNGFEIHFLSSHIVPTERLKRIGGIKKESLDKKVVISTQLVEAGVDIDLERVIRDLGPLDSINQVAGRANRNWRNGIGIVEIITLKEEKNQGFFYSYIYDPVLINNTKRILEYYSLVEEEDFLKLTDSYYQEILRTISADISENYLDAIKILNYEEIAKFALIEGEDQKIDIFVELDEEATDVWTQYEKMTEITDPKRRKQRFLEIRGKFYSYVISVSREKAAKNLPPEVLGIRFISKGQLHEYYDLKTGFKTEGENSPW